MARYLFYMGYLRPIHSHLIRHRDSLVAYASSEHGILSNQFEEHLRAMRRRTEEGGLLAISRSSSASDHAALDLAAVRQFSRPAKNTVAILPAEAGMVIAVRGRLHATVGLGGLH